MDHMGNALGASFVRAEAQRWGSRRGIEAGDKHCKGGESGPQPDSTSPHVRSGRASPMRARFLLSALVATVPCSSHHLYSRATLRYRVWKQERVQL